MIKFFEYNKGYEKNIKKYTKKDGLLSIVIFGIVILAYYVLAALSVNFQFVKNNSLMIGCIFNILIIGITLLFIKLNNQKLDTIGLYNGQWKKSCIIGIILACIFFINNCGSHLIQGSSLIDIKKIGTLIIYFLLVSFCEEITFRGYIGTRIYGLIKTKFLAIILVGLLFTIMHFPYRMMAYGMTLKDLTIDNFVWILDLIITHIIFNFIYTKTNSIYGSIIPHWISNLAYSIVNK